VLIDMGTTIRIDGEEIKVYESCSVTLSGTNRAGSFTLELPSISKDIVDKFRFGSDVEITQDGNVFRGWVINNGKSLNNVVKNVSIQGADYSARTQKIIVTESYINQKISDIVKDLFEKYVPWATTNNVETTDKSVTIKFPDKFLWDCMEQLSSLAGDFQWYIDETLDLNFFEPRHRINPHVIKTGTFRRGTANITPDTSKLVNRLWVKGGKALSEDFTQNITVSDNTPIPLYYTPRATTEGVIVVINGQQRTLGIQNVHDEGQYDFLLNAQEKLLIPDKVTSGTGTITYRYEYPIKILLEEPESQAQYGVFEDILTVDTDDRQLALELGLRHLAKYSQPVLTGSLEPFEGIYKPGELIKVEIPELNIDEYLQIREVTYDSLKGTGYVDRKISLESPERNLQGILKDINSRLNKLEKEVYMDDEGPVEKYVASEEFWGWTEQVDKFVNIAIFPSDSLFMAPQFFI